MLATTTPVSLPQPRSSISDPHGVPTYLIPRPFPRPTHSLLGWRDGVESPTLPASILTRWRASGSVGLPRRGFLPCERQR